MATLTGKTALVTGGSKGIGASIAKALAAEGASVVVNYASSKAGADAVVDAITAAGGSAFAVQGDIAQEADAQALVNATVQRFGGVDIVVNNGGVYEFSDIESISVDHFRRMFDVNVLGTLLVTKAAVPHLKSGASVINISSNITTMLMPQSAVYSGSKAAIDAVTVVLAKELGPRGIRVNAINPGMVATEGVAAAGFDQPDFAAQIIAQTPLGRIGQPEDIAKVAVFLASDNASWVTGDRLFVGGGSR